MEPTTINSFLDRFLAVADSGFGLIQGDVSYVLNTLIIISIALSGMQWALAGEAPMAPFFRKVLFIGLFAYLINNWDALATAINQSGAALGLRAGGNSMTLADLHNPGRVAQIGIDLFGRTVALTEGMNVLVDFIPMATVFIAALFAAIGFFVLALQVFVALIAFKLGALAAFVALPWGVFAGTSWVAERPLGWVAGSAIRLFVLGLVASISLSFVESLPPTLTLDAGGALQILLFGLTVLVLAWFAPMLAGEVMQGQPSLAGNHISNAGGSIAGGATNFVSNLQIISSGLGSQGASAPRPPPNVDYRTMRPRPKPPVRGKP